jgi:pimeloyl-ACP methyl ester carboxylesterase
VTVSAIPSDLHVAVDGSGRALVMSHGVGSSAEVWNGWVPALSPSYRVVRWDQPGHGRSPEVGADDYSGMLAYRSLTRVVGDESGVVLVGHSLGGYLSCRFAIEHPGQVAALVLVATGPGFRSPDAMEGWNADIRRQAAKATRPAMLVGLHHDTLVMDGLAAIACPVLLMVGSEDRAFLGATDYIERKIAGVERHTIDGAGHMMPETHAAQLAGLTADFLARRLT